MSQKPNRRPRPTQSFMDVLWLTCHEADLSMEQLADDLDLGTANLYKMVEPGETSRNFPASKLIALLRLTQDFRLLHLLCNRLGFEAVALGRAGRKTAKDLDELDTSWGNCRQTLQRLHLQGEITDAGLATIREMLAKLHGHHRAAEKALAAQQEFEFEGGEP